MNPLITIYLPTKNRLQTLKRAINSVLNQTYKNFELIIVDDASTDDTYGYLRSLKDERIKVFRNDISRGAPFCRNLAIKNAKGKFVTGLDDDDEFLPNRLEEMLKAYNEKYAFVFSDYYIDNGKKRFYKKIWNKKFLYFHDLLNKNVVGNQVFTTKEKFISAGLFDENLEAAQDYDMWLRLLKKYNVAYHLDKPLQIVYISKSSITNSENKKRGYKKVYLKYKKDMSINQRKYHISNYLLYSKKSKLLRFLPFNKDGIILLIKYLKKKG